MPVTPQFSLKKVQTRGGISYPDRDIETGSIHFISGKSGCGKSTLLHLLNGMLGEYSGLITYNGKDIRSADPLRLRQEVLLVSQSIYLFEGTVAENFASFYCYRDLPAPEPASMQSYLRLCSLSVPLDMPCSELSGGEQHRVYLAIFISFGAKAFLLDEPTAALDSHNASTMLDNICQFCRQGNITLIVVSHDIALAEKFAESHLILGNDHD